MSVPSPIETWVQRIRRLTPVVVDGGYDADHNEVVIVTESGVVNLPEPQEGSEVIVKTATENEINTVAPPGVVIDDVGQEISSDQWQSLYFAADDEQWYLINQLGDAVEGGERPVFEVSDLIAPEQIDRGDSYDVSFDIENTGGRGRDEITLSLDDDVLETTSDVTLDADGTDTITFEGIEATQRPGDYTLTVETPDSSDTVGIEIERPPSNVQVTSLEAPSDADAGDTIHVQAELTNEGSAKDNVGVEFITPAGVQESTEDDFGFLEVREYTFEYTAEDVVSVADLTVETPNDSDTLGVSINYGDPAVSVESLTAPAEADIGDEITVEADLLNVGQGGDDLGVSLLADDETLDTTTLDLDQDEETTVTFEYEVDLAGGTFDLAVETDADRRSQEIFVAFPPTETELSNLDVPDSVPFEDSATATADVTNIGDPADDLLVEFTIDGDVLNSTTVDLDFDETETVSFTFTADMLEQEITVGFETDDDSVSQLVDITFDDPFVTTSDYDAPVSVEIGQTRTFAATLENIGKDGQDIPVGLFADEGTSDEQVLESESLDIDGGGIVEQSFEHTIELDPGEYTVGIFTPHASSTQALTVDTPPTEILVDSFEIPDAIEQDDDFEATAEITNIGEEATGLSVDLIADEGTGSEVVLDEQTVGLDFDESKEVVFEATAELDIGSREIGVFTDDDSEVRTVEIVEDGSSFDVTITDADVN